MRPQSRLAGSQNCGAIFQHLKLDMTLVTQVLPCSLSFFFIHKMDNTGLAKLAIEIRVTAMRALFTKMRRMFLAGKRCLPFIMILTPRHTTSLLV